MSMTEAVVDAIAAAMRRDRRVFYIGQDVGPIGAALFGQRPIVEISFGEFLPAAMNQLINQAPNLRYMTGGVARVQVVIRTRVGDGPYGGQPEGHVWGFAHGPGLKGGGPAAPAAG